MAKRSVTVNYTGNQNAESKSFTDVNPLATAGELQTFGRAVVGLMGDKTYASVESTVKRNAYEQETETGIDEGDVFPTYLLANVGNIESDIRLINKVGSESIQDVAADAFEDETITISETTYTKKTTVTIRQTTRDPNFFTDTDIRYYVAPWFTGPIVSEDPTYYGEGVYWESKIEKVTQDHQMYWAFVITIRYTADQDPLAADTYLKVVLEGVREFGECVGEYRFRGGAE